MDLKRSAAVRTSYFSYFPDWGPLTPLLKVGEARPLIVNTTETRRVDLIVIGAYSKRNSPN